MKALILAAGYGSRLKPYTDHTPKPLFTYNRKPLLDKIIGDLARAGCTAAVVNTHHLGHRIERHITAQHYPIPVVTRNEPRILGTGGAIKNAADFFDDQPFLVINADIITDIDLAAVYRFHCAHRHPATLVLVDAPPFNSVHVGADRRISGFGEPAMPGNTDGLRKLAFTGIQVLDRCCLDFFPPAHRFSHSIDTYGRMLADGRSIAAYIAEGCSWTDIGTPRRYKNAVIAHMATSAFEKAFPESGSTGLRQTRLKGDGSDRHWYRWSDGRNALIMVDHGIRSQRDTCEVDAFVNIGRHLHRSGIPVPAIIDDDRFAGLVFLEDLGDIHLQDVVKKIGDRQRVSAIYRKVIDGMLVMAFGGAQGFDRSWPYQTAKYDRKVILDYECRYFVDAFLNGYLSLSLPFSDFAAEFGRLADQTVTAAYTGFMHRDFQSRNIMINNNRPYFIDFQGGRMGPVQYDLASLLIDPYVNLPREMQQDLLDYGIARLAANRPLDTHRFRAGFRCCALTRNLQMLGAFGYLSRVAGKTGFAAYIPAAVASLKKQVAAFDTDPFPLLKKTVMAL